MASTLNERLLSYVLGHFWSIFFAALLGAFGLLWALLGLTKALLVAALAALGFYFGKWMDEGRPNAGLFRALRRFFD